MCANPTVYIETTRPPEHRHGRRRAASHWLPQPRGKLLIGWHLRHFWDRWNTFVQPFCFSGLALGKDQHRSEAEIVWLGGFIFAFPALPSCGGVVTWHGMTTRCECDEKWNNFQSRTHFWILFIPVYVIIYIYNHVWNNTHSRVHTALFRWLGNSMIKVASESGCMSQFHFWQYTTYNCMFCTFTQQPPLRHVLHQPRYFRN